MVSRRREGSVWSLGDNVVVLEGLQRDGSLEVWVDPRMGSAMVLAFHVCREARAIAPATDHRYLTGVAIGLQDLEVDEPVVALHVTRAATKRVKQLRRPIGAIRKRETETYTRRSLRQCRDPVATRLFGAI